MTINSLLEPFQHFGVNLGLSRISKLLDNLGNPHHRVPLIHVAGTNGKGSVCAYLSSVLTNAGYITARYTSPHLVDWTERICINEQPINTADFCQLISQVKAAIDDQYPSPTQFEVITAAAWLYFAQQQVDIAVIEVGLGGRLDATNVCSHPLVTIITSIGLDHCQQLGATIAEIAREKAGIFKAGCPAVVGPLPSSAQSVVQGLALELNCPLLSPQPAEQIAPVGWAKYRGIKYPLVLSGEIQLINSALAIATLEILQEQGWQIPLLAIVHGMGKTTWPGRMDWVTWQQHRLLIDGAHNPPAAEALRDYVDSLTPPEMANSVTWVIGMLETKDHAGILQALLHPGDRLYLVPVPDSNSANLRELAHLAQRICPELDYCQTYSDLFLALTEACLSTNGLIVLCGSLYLLGHFFRNRANFPTDYPTVEQHQ